MILRKLKRLLGLSSGEDGGRSERDVTMQERETAAAEEPAGAGEVDEPVAAETDADASTESLVDEEIAQEESSGRAEPAEAAGPESEDETTDVESTEVAIEEETAEANETDDSPPVDEVKGIGPAYSERLGEIGIVTVADLAGADAEEVAERTTAPEKTVRKWIDRAADHG